LSAKHALLGLLLHRPAYPYELADRLQGRLGPAWAINSGQLYQTIYRLEKDGLIERVDGAPEARADRHVFAITDDGAEEFGRWFDQSASVARLSRRPLLVKITLAGPERLRDALDQVDAYELDCATRLKQLAAMKEEAVTAEGPWVRADHVLLRLNLSADVFQLEGELRWARHAHEMIAWLLERDVLWPTGRERSPYDDVLARQGAREELFGRMAARDRQGLDAS
jgi:DNA-binding PadR family transcriptional regulator